MTDDIPNLVLASGSPRRREMLAGLGLEFEVRVPAVDESAAPDESPEALVQRLANVKAAAVARNGEIVLAADTVVVLDGRLLGKPLDTAQACHMLKSLTGRRHTVLTGVSLRDGTSGESVTGLESSEVKMTQLSDEEIAWYVDSGEPLDKAGSYAIQGVGALFVEAVYGNYSNVVGLPLPLTRELFRQLGHDLRRFLSV